MNGSSENTGAEYGNAFQELSDAVEAKDMNGIRQHTKNTLDVAKNLKLPHLEIATLCMSATGFLSIKQLPTVLKLYDEAYKIAKEAESNEVSESSETNSDLYAQLSIQILLYKSSALLTQQPPQYNTISEAYQHTAEIIQHTILKKENPKSENWVDGGILYLYLFECLRILGYCQEQMGRQQAALKHYIKAVSTAEKMGPDIRKSAPLKIVGLALLHLCRKLGMKTEYYFVIDKMNGLIGEGWEKEPPPPQKK